MLDGSSLFIHKWRANCPHIIYPMIHPSGSVFKCCFAVCRLTRVFRLLITTFAISFHWLGGDLQNDSSKSNLSQCQILSLPSIDNYVTWDETLTSLCLCFLTSTVGASVPSPWIIVRVDFHGHHWMVILTLITTTPIKWKHGLVFLPSGLRKERKEAIVQWVTMWNVCTAMKCVKRAKGILRNNEEVSRK